MSKINMDDTPIIFIHFSNSSFLKYTLESAKFFNPEKRVILLGDKTNNKYAHLGIEHYYFADYSTGNLIETFNSVYKFIAGEKQKYSFKQKFFFARWFMIYNFVKEQSIQQFWTFDSDTLIITSLTEQESKFSDIDCTEQCNGSCMNGLVRNPIVVEEYLEKINELFLQKDYLKKQQTYFNIYSNRRFTEMDAYQTFKDDVIFKGTRLNKIIDGEFFDDCLLNAHTFEVYPFEINGRRTLKKLYLGKNGNVYATHLLSRQLVKFNTINLSWLPDIFFWVLLKHVKRKNWAKYSDYQNLGKKNIRLLSIRPMMIFYQLFERPLKWFLRKLKGFRLVNGFW